MGFKKFKADVMSDLQQRGEFLIDWESGIFRSGNPSDSRTFGLHNLVQKVNQAPEVDGPK